LPYLYSNQHAYRQDKSLNKYYNIHCNQILAKYNNNSIFLAEYVYGANGMIAKYKESTGYYWYYKDHLGSTRQLGKTADGSYSSQQRRDYYPYGELTYSAGDETGYTYTGKEHYSGSIGLTFFGRRYYDPSLGRWLTPDPAGQYASPYVYCATGSIHDTLQ
jgi:RHS repeat-associated protein